MIGTEEPLGEALGPGAKFCLIHMRHWGMIQQILLIKPSELCHRGDHRGRVAGLPWPLEHLIRLLQQRAFAAERAGLPEIDQAIFSL